jgi:exopolysaccharide biosynthesis operon protein EpsL
MAPAMVGAQPAAEGFQIRGGVGVEHDSNVLRQPNAQSDTVGTASIGLKFDKQYSLQRIRADFEATTYRYQDFSELNYNTINYNAAWDWSITPRFHGVVSADRKQFRETTADVLTGINRVGRRTERTEVAEGIYEVGAAWRALAGVSHYDARSTEPNTWDASPSVRSAYVGAGYQLGSGTAITARLRHGKGEYRDPSVTAATGDFKEDEFSVNLKWPITVKTTIDATLGRLKREHDGAPQRDFSGWVGAAVLNWEITAKTRLEAGASRGLSATGLATGGNVVSDRFWLGPVWKPTEHTAVNLRYERVARKWHDVPAGSVEVGRHDTQHNAMIGFDWLPRPKIIVSTSIRNERLKSNLFFSGYRATVYGVAAKVYF